MSRRAETLGGERWVLDVSEEGSGEEERPFWRDVLGSSGRERTGVPCGSKQTVIVTTVTSTTCRFLKLLCHAEDQEPCQVVATLHPCLNTESCLTSDTISLSIYNSVSSPWR
uniref:Uncharacterized protein n=1 Tax=Micrurus corallinus TaxID=54390 RepID=A0A2D4FXL6_MICCO